MTRARYAALLTAPPPTTLQRPLQGLTSRRSPRTPPHVNTLPPPLFEAPHCPHPRRWKTALIVSPPGPK